MRNKKAGAGVIILVLLIIIVIGIGGSYFYYIFSSPRVISETSEIVLACSDSDGNDIYTKGHTNYERQEPGESSLYELEDICNYHHKKTKSQIGLVRETWCEGNILKEVLSTCGKGYVCRQGKCVEGDSTLSVCEDSDGGKNIYEKGNVYGYGGSGSDDCWMYALDDPNEEGGLTNECQGANCYVYEYYCNGDIKDHEIMACPNGCKSGACI